FEPELAGWHGIGFVVQAYQKRCPFVIDALVDLARRSSHRLMVRLVKGAYWDSEIKRAQVDGLDGYPVYTRKAYTDVAYLACARRLLAAPDAVFAQFATHNAQTLAAIHELAGGKLARPCRIYAPVGTHETLLAYLVRRLLENGANTSFVNRIADAAVPIDELVEDPVTTVERIAAAEGGAAPRVVGRPHPAIPLPRQIYGGARLNSRGLDLSNEDELALLAEALRASRAEAWAAAPMLAANDAAANDRDDGDGRDRAAPAGTALQPVRNPADHDDIVGHVREATLADVDRAVASARAGAASWAATPAADRAALLEQAADSLEADLPRLLGLLAREAGKTYPNGIAEVREAVDFLRFYAAQARRDLGVGDVRPLGPVVCISPW